MTATPHPRALITGASGAIGGAIAEELASRGYQVLLNGRDIRRLEARAAVIRSGGGDAAVVPGDLADTSGLDAVAGAVRHQPLDLLVHSQGAFHLAPFQDTPLEALDRQLAVNLRAPWELTRRLDPRRCGLRDLVFVSSTAALAPKAGTAAYTAAKAALGALADSLRDEFADAGVRVLTIYPGRTASAMQAQVRAAEGVPYDPAAEMQPADVAAMVIAAVTLPRSAEVTEIVVRQRRPDGKR